MWTWHECEWITLEIPLTTINSPLKHVQAQKWSWNQLVLSECQIGLMVPILSQEYMLPPVICPFGTAAETECLSLAQIGQRWSINPERADRILSSTQNTHSTYRAGGIIWYTAGENYHWGTRLRIRIESVISGTSNGNGKLIAVNSNVAHVLVHGSRRSVNQSYWKFSGATIASCNRDRNPLVLSEYPKICLIVNLCRLSVKKYSVLCFLIPHIRFGIRLDINSWGQHKRAE
jgi:hypothetical protein